MVSDDTAFLAADFMLSVNDQNVREGCFWDASVQV